MNTKGFLLSSLLPVGHHFVSVARTANPVVCWKSEGLKVSQKEIPISPPDARQQIRVTSAVLSEDTLVLGLGSGYVICVNVSTSHQTNVKVGTKPIVALFLEGRNIFCSESGGKVFELRRQGAKHTNTWNSNARMVVQLKDTIPVLTSANGLLYLGVRDGNLMKSYRITDGKLVHKWVVCPTPPLRQIVGVPMSSESISDGGGVLTSSQHRHLSLYVSDDEVYSLAADSIPSFVAVSKFVENHIHVLALTQSGIINIWVLSHLSSNNMSLPASTQIRCPPATTSGKYTIHSVQFRSANTITVVCGFGRDGPFFEDVIYIDSKGNPEPSITLTLSSNERNPTNNNKRKSKKKEKEEEQQEEADIEIEEELSQEKNEKEKKPKAPASGQTKKAGSEHVLGPKDLISLPTASKVKDQQIIPIKNGDGNQEIEDASSESKEEHAEKKSLTGVAAESVAKPLVQSIRAKDVLLFRKLLKGANESKITATVERLPHDVILPFLQMLAEYFDKPSDFVLTAHQWAKAILVIHMSYLLSNPAVAPAIAPLQQAIEHRVRVFDRLSKAHSRIAFLLELDTEEENGWKLEDEPVFEYTESAI